TQCSFFRGAIGFLATLRLLPRSALDFCLGAFRVGPCALSVGPCTLAFFAGEPPRVSVAVVGDANAPAFVDRENPPSRNRRTRRARSGVDPGEGVIAIARPDLHSEWPPARAWTHESRIEHPQLVDATCGVFVGSAAVVLFRVAGADNLNCQKRRVMIWL